MNSKKKDIINHPKKIDNLKVINKNKKHKYLSNSLKKINLELPPILNFNSNNIALINNSTNKDCKNILQYDDKLINVNRYKIGKY